MPLMPENFQAEYEKQRGMIPWLLKFVPGLQDNLTTAAQRTGGVVGKKIMENIVAPSSPMESAIGTVAPLGLFAGPKATGFAKAEGKFSNLADRMPRFEISDEGAKIIKAKFRPSGGTSTTLWAGQDTKLGEVLDHPELFKQYPELANAELRAYIDPKQIGNNGFYSTVQGKPYINITSPDMESLKRGILHEIQHAIQEKEGFARGGEPC